jgi:hypothetical protein
MDAAEIEPNPEKRGFKILFYLLFNMSRAKISKD